MKSNIKDLETLISYLKSLGLLVLIKNLNSSSGPKVYEKYGKTLDMFFMPTNNWGDISELYPEFS
jgi:hypothetical protein